MALLSWGFFSWFFWGADLVELGGLHRRARFWVAVRLALLVGVGFVAFAIVKSPASALAFAGLAVLSVVWFVRRRAARSALFDVASRPLEGGASPAATSVPARLFPWFALRMLSIAVDAARRGDVDGARRALDDLDVDALTPAERRFESAARALVARRWGDKREAAQRALVAFPTGALALDEELARITVEDAWHDANRLAFLAEAWDAHAPWPPETTSIGRLRYLIDLKLGRADGSGLDASVASRITEEARALGDAELVNALTVTRSAPDYRS